jgi:DNA-binding MarR family transcriptional regulator
MRLIFELAGQLRAVLDRRLMEVDLTLSQAAVLVKACQREQCRANQLAKELGIDPPGTTRLLDRLESKGLITRRPDPTDRRAILVEATEEGRALLPHIGPVFGQMGAALLKGLDRTESERFTTLLRMCLANVSEVSRG